MLINVIVYFIGRLILQRQVAHHTLVWVISISWSWPLQMLLWVLSWLDRKNLIPHSTHWYSFRLRWRLSWSFLFPLVVNFFPQKRQWNRFSPVCILMWWTRLLLYLNTFLQTLNGHWWLSALLSNSSWSSLSSAPSKSSSSSESISNWALWCFYYILNIMSGKMYLKTWVLIHEIICNIEI